jgi:site-specific recombinase XerD
LSGAAGYAAAARSARTWQAYRADFRRFQRWCATQAPCPTPLPATPATVAAYLAAHATSHRPNTLARWCSALAVAHDLAGHPSPTRDPGVRTVLAGIRRTRRTRPDRVAAAGPPELRTMLDRLDPAHPRDARDRALILIGFAGALRRSELVALTLADLVVDTDGLRVFIAASKTDPAGTGHTRGLAYGTHAATCPVRAWQAWLAHRIASPVEDSQQHPTPPADRTAPVAGLGADSPSPSPPLLSGSAFVRVDRWGNLGAAALSPRSVALIVSARATAAGLPGHWAGHSLRRGFATTAYRRGTSEIALMRHGRWRSTSAMRGYIDEGAVWVDNPTHVLGL